MTAYFGSDGDGIGGIVPSTPSGTLSVLGVAQDYMYLCGGQASEAGTPSSVSVYLASYDGSTASNHYVAVYKGGTSSDPSGATLVGESANITTNFGTSPGWQTFNLTGSPGSWATNDYIWVAILGRGADAQYGMRPREVDAAGSGTSYIEQWIAKGAGTYDRLYLRTSVTGTTPPATVGSGAWDTQMCLAAYITYEPVGAPQVTVTRVYQRWPVP